MAQLVIINCLNGFNWNFANVYGSGKQYTSNSVGTAGQVLTFHHLVIMEWADGSS